MTGRRTVTLVARREIRERLHQKSFLISTGITLAIVLAIAVLPSLLGGEGGTTYRVAAIDAEGGETVRAAQRAARGFDVEVDLRRYPDAAAARRALEGDDLDAVVTGGSVESRDQPEDILVGLLSGAASRAASERALREAGLSDAQRRAALDPPPLTIRTLEPVDARRDERSGIAFAAVLLLYGQLLTFGYWVASGVVEEKASRVVEILLAAIRPGDLLAGKVIGLGLLGLAQLLIIALVGVGAAGAAGSVELDGDLFAAAGLSLLWFVLGYAFYSCAFACAGAIVPRQEELQSSMTPLTTVILASFFVAFAVLQDPDGTLATVSSFLPTTAPMTMPPRILLGEASAVEIVGAIVVTAGAAALLVPVAARVYRGAILRTGASIKLREAWRARA